MVTVNYARVMDKAYAEYDIICIHVDGVNVIFTPNINILFIYWWVKIYFSNHIEVFSKHRNIPIVDYIRLLMRGGTFLPRVLCTVVSQITTIDFTNTKTFQSKIIFRMT